MKHKWILRKRVTIKCFKGCIMRSKWPNSPLWKAQRCDWKFEKKKTSTWTWFFFFFQQKNCSSYFWEKLLETPTTRCSSGRYMTFVLSKCSTQMTSVSKETFTRQLDTLSSSSELKKSKRLNVDNNPAPFPPHDWQHKGRCLNGNAVWLQTGSPFAAPRFCAPHLVVMFKGLWRRTPVEVMAKAFVATGNPVGRVER